MDGHDNLFQSYGRQASVLADQVFLFCTGKLFYYIEHQTRVENNIV